MRRWKGACAGIKKALLVLLLLMLLPGVAWATAQFPDFLIYQGETLPIFSNPLDSYFDREHPRPRHLFQYTCTACWRGYVATWKIEKGDLYLVRLVKGDCSAKPEEIDVGQIFSGQSLPVKAAWFSGTIRIPQGKQMLYVHMGYGSVYERERVLSFEKGRLAREDTIDNTKSPLPSGWEREQIELEKLKKLEDKPAD
jgi:hypothetical protein